METFAYALSTLGFGFFCWCVGVYMGSQAVAKRIVEEMGK
jgi:hypothetical protein